MQIIWHFCLFPADATQGAALKEELARTEAELVASTERINDAQGAANAAEAKCQQLQSERDVFCTKVGLFYSWIYLLPLALLLTP